MSLEERMTQLMDAITESQAASENQFKAIKEEIKRNQDEMKKTQEEMTQNVVRRVKRSRPAEFKRKGNEKQFRFNDEVVEKLESVEADLEQSISSGEVSEEVSASLEKAKKTIKEGMILLEERQKMIRLADRSEYGWEIVNEYEADELAEDSDDEKRISKAEKAAEQRLSKKKKPAVQKKGTMNKWAPRDHDWWQAANWRQASYGPYMLKTAGQGSSFGLPVARGSGLSVPGVGGAVRPTRPIGPCFACGEFGHLKSACTKGAGSSTKYPYNACVDGSTGEVDAMVVQGSLVLGSREVDNDGESFVVEQVIVDEWEEVDVSQSGGGSLVYCKEMTAGGVSVKGRLKQNLDYWEKVLQAPPSIVSIVAQGYILPFREVPPGKRFSNQMSAIKNNVFVSQAISELMSDGRLREVQEVPLVCSPLLVVANREGKQRLVINLKYVNKFLKVEKFKYEDIRTGLLYFEKGEHLCTFDLKSGYHHIDIHIASQQYLGCEWKGKYYVFTVLPFGLSTACYVFTKLTRPLIRWWRGQGIKVVMYIDDGVIVMPQSEAVRASRTVQATLQSAGFVLNLQKSRLVPAYKGAWLGFEVDLETGVIKIPESKVTELIALLRMALNDRLLKARAIASIVGKIIAMGLGIGPVARLRTRALYRLLAQRTAWHDTFCLDDEAIDEVSFWINSINSFNGQSIWKSASAVRLVYSDASSTGFGGYVLEHGCHVAHGQWTRTEMAKSSTWRELVAVKRTLQAVASKIAYHRVRWFTDNQNVVRIINTGSRVAELQTVALEIFSLAFRHQIKIDPEWIPRDQNQLADYYSRLVDYDDWAINPAVFNVLDIMWGPHTIDRFANSNNAQLERFNSRYWNPGTEAVDAFTVDWSGETNWWCPPVCLIPRVVEHARACRASGTLIVPYWVSAPFWPILCPRGTEFAEMVTDVMQLPCSCDLIVPGLVGASLFRGQKWPNTEVLALRVQWC